MSGGPGYHGWTHRPASQGGTDPVPFTPQLPYARVARGGAQVAVTTDTDSLLDWSSFLNQGGADYFDTAFTDGAGVEGIQILQPGVYSFMAYTRATENNAGNVLPPTLCYHITTALDGVQDFGTDWFAVGPHEGWLKHYPAGAYTPPTKSAFSSANIQLGGSFTVPITSSDLAFRDAFTCRIFSEGSTGAWKYGTSFLFIIRLGDIAA